MKSATVLLTALLAGVSFSAMAQTGDTGTDDGMGTGTGMGMGAGQTQTFTELDTNNDGVLDQDEVEQGNMTGDFGDIDANGDDEVDRNEYYQYQRQQR